MESGTVVISKANCGIPQFHDGKILYSGTEKLMAEYVQIAMNSGAKIIGGCCGTTYAHVRAMRKAMDQHQVTAPPTLAEIERRLELCLMGLELSLKVMIQNPLKSAGADAQGLKSNNSFN